MINVKLASNAFWDNKVEGYFFFLKEDFELSPAMKKIQDECYPHLKEIFKKHKFTGKLGQSFVLTGLINEELVQFIFIGLGKLDKVWSDALEDFRRATGNLVSLMKKLEIKEGVVLLPTPDAFGVDEAELLLQATIVSHMAAYDFTEFKSAVKEKFKGTLYLISSEVGSEAVKNAVNEGTITGKAVNLARHWVDLPANVLTPTMLGEEASQLAKDKGLKCKVFGRDEAFKLGMGGFCAVDAGSEQDGKFIVLEYNVSKSAPTIALIGKGVTFDTGGISLKPASVMSTMKSDMSGAAAVLATLGAVAQIKPEVNVVGIVPAVENMPSGGSCRQDDIVTFMNGKTAEIKNTDAEGRLILADALCYAEKNYKPDVMIDIATLTGACVVALGHHFTGAMTRDDKLAEALDKIGKISGDRTWRLPLHDDFKPANKSNVADIANCGAAGHGAGTITAGLFLENFVKDTPWVHLDIGGTAFEVPGVGYLGKGATGVGVRLFLEFIKSYTR